MNACVTSNPFGRGLLFWSASLAGLRPNDRHGLPAEHRNALARSHFAEWLPSRSGRHEFGRIGVSYCDVRRRNVDPALHFSFLPSRFAPRWAFFCPPRDAPLSVLFWMIISGQAKQLRGFGRVAQDVCRPVTGVVAPRGRQLRLLGGRRAFEYLAIVIRRARPSL